MSCSWRKYEFDVGLIESFSSSCCFSMQQEVLPEISFSLEWWNETSNQQSKSVLRHGYLKSVVEALHEMLNLGT